MTKDNITIQLLAIFAIATSLSVSVAFAQQSSSAPIGEGVELVDIISVTNLGILAVAFIAAGIGYSILGWQQKRRQTRTPIDYKKLLKTTIIGIGIGVASLIYIIYSDSSIENLHVTTFHGFASLTMWAFSIVVTTTVVLKKLFPDLAKQTEISNNSDDDKSPALK